MEEIKKHLTDTICSVRKGSMDDNQFRATVEHNLDLMKEYAVSKELENERQFILNVLDGVDEADRQMGNIEGGTLAIRHALKSRTICK